MHSPATSSSQYGCRKDAFDIHLLKGLNQQCGCCGFISHVGSHRGWTDLKVPCRKFIEFCFWKFWVPKVGFVLLKSVFSVLGLPSGLA